MAKIFVGNFSFSVEDEQLREHFAKIGSVISAKVMKEGHGGRSRGFGFVEFTAADEAEKAIKELDGTVWEGRVLKVSEDRSNQRGDHHHNRSSDGPSGGSSGGSSGSSGSGGGGGGGGGYESHSHHRSAGGPTGYFRAQPLELGVRRRKKLDPFSEDDDLSVDYKDVRLLNRFISERGRILPRRMTGLTAHNQRQVTRAIKRAQHLSLMPYHR